MSWVANNNVPDPGQDPTLDPGPAPQVRPMGPADYASGVPVRQARRRKPPPQGLADHPWRDMLIGVALTAAAFWAVPKALDYTLEHGFGHSDDQAEEYEFEAEDD